MEMLSKHGCQYRTRLMLHNQAERFARCLRNNPAFGNAFVSESATATSDRRFFVAYHPANPKRLAELLDRQQAKREVKALTEGHGYLFVLDDTGAFHWCLSTSGECYEVSEAGCSCPDAEYRCRAAGIQCKHQIALKAGVGEIVSRPAPVIGAGRMLTDWE